MSKIQVRLPVPGERRIIEMAHDHVTITLFDENDEQVGEFCRKNGRWHFTGDVDESAYEFVQAVKLLLATGFEQEHQS